MTPQLPQMRGLDPVDRVLVFLIILFALLVIAISKWSPNDGQTFQIIGTLCTGFAAAFLSRIKPADKKTDQPQSPDAPQK